MTKASVTIVFDNKDKSQSPIGFEEYAQISVTRQIVLGGTSKYLVNGHRAQQHTVQNLFQSVQLNINNPNFLIMQGRITKVLNMKAVEILSMIEEAAGTRMFEDRRDKAFKTMAKKELKVQEITELLKDEIDPKLEKLRTEKRAFLDFQQTQNDLERLTKLVVAHDYVKGKERMQLSLGDLESKNSRARELEANAVRLKSEMSHLEEDMKKVKADREKELRKGGRFQALEDQVKAHSHEMVRITTALELKQNGKSDEASRRAEVDSSAKDIESQLQKKKDALDSLQSKYDLARAQLNQRTQELEQKEELLQSLQTGIASQEGQESGYQAQLQEAKNRVVTASTAQAQAKLRISHLEKQIKEDEPRARKAKEQNSGLLKGLESLRSDAKKLEAKLAKLGYEPGKEEQMLERKSVLGKEIRALKDQADVLRRKVSNVDFSYSDPFPGFDRSKVKGPVAQLFSIDKDKVQAATALEVCAGGRLYNVVVDSAETGTHLLQGGRLKKRVTIIPLNKISAFKASAEKIAAAQKLAPGKAGIALSLIGYDKEVSAAMDYVFGSTLICEDADTAKQVTFDPAVRLKSVTLEGDVYDPSGTLSGGSAPTSSGVLQILGKLTEVTKQMSLLETELSSLQSQMTAEKEKRDTIRQCQQKLELKTHEIGLTEKQIASNSSSSIIQAVEDMNTELQNAKQEIADSKAEESQASKDVKRIEKDIQDFDKNKDGKLAELQSSVDSLRKSSSKDSTALKLLQKDVQEARLESEQSVSEFSNAREQLDEIAETLKSYDAEINALDAKHGQVKDSHDLAQAHLEDERRKLTGFDEELRSLEETSKLKASRISEESLEARKLRHTIEKVQKDRQGAEALVAQIESEHDWVAEEKDSFGRANSPYDFKGQNIAECKSSLKSVTERFQGMRKKINPKVMTMIDSVEKKEVSLKNMMRTVIKDKRKIEETISSLDEYKKEALRKTWTKVNADFGAIFAELLPGSFAKLDPPEGKTIHDGLEVKVSLGKVWKQSLAELSGGQR